MWFWWKGPEIDGDGGVNGGGCGWDLRDEVSGEC